jgi:hypothetical protein
MQWLDCDIHAVLRMELATSPVQVKLEFITVAMQNAPLVCCAIATSYHFWSFEIPILWFWLVRVEVEPGPKKERIFRI